MSTFINVRNVDCWTYISTVCW